MYNDNTYIYYSQACAQSQVSTHVSYSNDMPIMMLHGHNHNVKYYLSAHIIVYLATQGHYIKLKSYRFKINYPLIK